MKLEMLAMRVLTALALSSTLAVILAMLQLAG